jgi:hypothetical protein
MRGPGRFVALITLVVSTVACGYALAGRGNALPAHIRLVGVPNFINHSTIPEIEIALSDAVRAEFVSRGRYVVQPDSTGVDAVLTGIVVSADRRPLTFTSNNQASSYTITITTNVEFKDLIDDKVLWANPSFRSSDEYQVPVSSSSGASTDLSALFTQLPNARERLSKKFAREVVSSIFEAF